MRHLITVGLPVYNAMPFLPETVESLLGQRERAFDLLIVDDGSTDGSADYLRALRDPRVRVITQRNRGLTATLNRMLHEVNTPWLVRHDADDIAYSDRTRHILASIAEHPEAGMFYSLADYYSDGKRFGRFRTTRGSPGMLRELTQAGYLLSVCHPTVTLNVDKAVACGGYRFDLRIEDIDLWWRMALAHDIHLISEVDVGVRHNFRSSSARDLSYQVRNTLYVQYLLLAHLHQREPLPYESVKESLAGIVNTRTLRFRTEMRSANASAGERSYRAAIGHFARAFCASPRAFVSRILYEIHRDKSVRQGERPDVLLRKSSLWDLSVAQRDLAIAAGVTR